jgi:hypothetical protein
VSYLTDLQREVATRASRRGAATKLLVPLDAQVAALTATLPAAVLHRPWSLEELIPRLEGKYRPRPATRSVAQALRRLGWQQRRCWKKTGLNRRLWVPPAQL